MKFLRFGLGRRFLILYIVVVGLLSVGMGIFIYHQSERLFITSKTEQAREIVYWALTHTEPIGQLRADDLANITERLSYSPSPDISLFLLNSSGGFLYALGQGENSYTYHLQSPSLAGVIEKKTEASFIAPAGDREHRTLVYIFPILDSTDSILGFIQSETRLEEVDSSLAKLKIALTLGFSLFFVTACILLFVFTKASLRSIEDMAHISSVVAAGDLNQRVTLPRRRDELYGMALTFNTMLDFVQDYIAKEKQNQEIMKRFLADVAHEFRSPLTLLKGHTDLLLHSGKDDQDTFERSLEVMRTTLGRLTRLTNDLLTLGRLDSGMELKLEDLDVNSLCQEVCEISRVLAGDREITLQASGQTIVKADIDLMRRVLWNLLENAIHYTDPNGKIAVTIVADKGQCRVTVQDDGEGIAPENLPHIFQRFYRTTRSRPGGMGLGLAIAKAIVEAHRGRISIESTVGSGTIVTISLPSGF